MRFIFSLLLIIFFSSTNINAADTNTLELNNKQINGFLKEITKANKIPNNFKKEKKFDIQKLKPFLFIAIIIYIILLGLLQYLALVHLVIVDT